MEAIADIMEFVNLNEIPSDLTIHSDAQAAIARVSHTGTGPGQDRATRVVKAVQKRKERGWRTSIEWVLGHSGVGGDEHAGQLTGGAAAGEKTGRTSIAWLKERIPHHYSMAKDTETERGKDSILPPAPKKSFLDGAVTAQGSPCPFPRPASVRPCMVSVVQGLWTRYYYLCI
jgi:hypothetical protein